MGKAQVKRSSAEHPNGKPRIVKTYDFLDENSKLLFQEVRYLPKKFRQRRPDGKGSWIWNLEGVPPVLHNRPALRKADPRTIIYVVEDLPRMRTASSPLGLLATTNSMGAGKWRPEHSEELRSRTVVILADNDAAGKAARRRRSRVAPGYRGCRGSSCFSPACPDKGDVSRLARREVGNTVEGLFAEVGRAWEAQRNAEGPLPLTAAPDAPPFPLDVFPIIVRTIVEEIGWAANAAA